MWALVDIKISQAKASDFIIGSLSMPDFYPHPSERELRADLNRHPAVMMPQTIADELAYLEATLRVSAQCFADCYRLEQADELWAHAESISATIDRWLEKDEGAAQ